MKKMLSVMMVLTVLVSMFAGLGVQAAAAEADEVILLATAGDPMGAGAMEELAAAYEDAIVLSVSGLTAGEVPEGYDIVWFAQQPEKAEEGYVALYPGAATTLAVGEKTVALIGVDKTTDVEQLEALAGEDAYYVIAVGSAAAEDVLADVDMFVTAGTDDAAVTNGKTIIVGEGDEPIAVITVRESEIVIARAAAPASAEDEETVDGEEEVGDETDGEDAGEEGTDPAEDESDENDGNDADDADETDTDEEESDAENENGEDATGTEPTADDNDADPADEDNDEEEEKTDDPAVKEEREAALEDGETELTWAQGSADGAVAKLTAAVDTVSVGPKGENKETLVEGQQYELDPTNKEVTITTAYLNGQSAGDYEVEFTFQEDDEATYKPLTVELAVVSSEAGETEEPQESTEPSATPEPTTEPTATPTPTAEPEDNKLEKTWDRNTDLVLTFEGRTPTGVEVWYGESRGGWKTPSYANTVDVYSVSGSSITLLPALVNGGTGYQYWPNSGYTLRITFESGDPVELFVTLTGTEPTNADESTSTTSPTATAAPTATTAPTATGEKAPSTGDENPIGLYIVILLVLVVALAVVIIILVKRKKNNR